MLSAMSRFARPRMFTIGEFSKITGLTVKTLRFYHEQGLLTPTCVDDQTGYRYYAETKAETARIIARLRGLNFSLTEIAQILTRCEDDADILDSLQRRRDAIEKTIGEYRDISRSLDQIISQEREAREAMRQASFEVAEKTLDKMLIAGVRMKGKYCDCGRAFAQLGRRLGRYICGKPMLLIYDMEYKEDDADFEACMPIRKGGWHVPEHGGEGRENISVRELPGGRCLTLLHQGPYDELGRSYCKLLDFIKRQGHEIQSPCREVYIKGPGMIFKGNPKKYLTELQMVIKETA
jgi:DNA-binding transcriptional MerR regulator